VARSIASPIPDTLDRIASRQGCRDDGGNEAQKAPQRLPAVADAGVNSRAVPNDPTFRKVALARLHNTVSRIISNPALPARSGPGFPVIIVSGRPVL
jgi:hypothetical protein